MSFIGGTAAGGANNRTIHLATGTTVTPISLTRRFSALHQLNNAGMVAGQDLGSAGGVVKTFIRLWSQGAVQKIAEAGVELRVNFVILIDPITLLPFPQSYIGVKPLSFDVVYAPSVNNRQEVAFVGTGGPPGQLSTTLLTSIPGTAEPIVLTNIPASNVALRPSIADDGSVVVRVGGSETNSIVRFEPGGPGTYSSATIATAAMGFDALSNTPVLSDDGRWIGFWGKLSAAGADALSRKQSRHPPLTPGPGLFLAFKSGADWVIVRVTGESFNGQLDPGESFTDLNKNGRFDSGEPDVGGVEAVSSTSRIGIAGTKMVYLAQQFGRQGLYVSEFSPGVVRDARTGETTVTMVVGGPKKLIEQGENVVAPDPVTGTDRPLFGPIKALGIHDPVSCGGVAYWAQADSGEEAIVAHLNDSVASGCESQRVAPVEGGVRESIPIPDGMIPSADRRLLVRLFRDDDQNGQPSAGEPFVSGMDVRVSGRQDGPVSAYFTPPPYDPALGALEGRRVTLSLAVEGDNQRLVLTNSFVYTADPVDGIHAIELGMMTAIREAMELGPLAGEALRSYGTVAGSRAETAIAGLLRRAQPMGQPGASTERSALTRAIEQMPARLRDFTHRSRPGGASFSTAVRAAHYGQTLHSVPEFFDEHLLLTLGSGSLVMRNDPAIQASDSPAGGYLWLPVDGRERSINPAEAHGWRGTLAIEEHGGLVLKDLQAMAVGRDNAVEAVARRISTPSLWMEGSPRPFTLDAAALSHVYIQPAVKVTPQESGAHLNHQALTEWIAAACYRLPLDGVPLVNNEARAALFCRQTFGLSAPYNDFEPSGCALMGQVYPLVTFGISDPDNPSGEAPSLRVNQRIGLNPQEAAGTDNRYYAGLFRDEDVAWRMPLPGTPGELCQPLPFWVNIFTEDQNTVPLVERETVFDTDDGTPVITPDNIHLHHEHDEQRTGRFSQWLFGEDPFVEAPGSFNGTVHFHWRWGRHFKGFGDGRILLPPDQHWKFALVRTAAPEDYHDAADAVINAPILTAEKVLRVSANQSHVRLNRQYYTFSTGFGYSMGRFDSLGCFQTVILDFGGYRAIQLGFKGEIDGPDAIAALRLGGVFGAVAVAGGAVVVTFAPAMIPIMAGAAAGAAIEGVILTRDCNRYTPGPSFALAAADPGSQAAAPYFVAGFSQSALGTTTPLDVIDRDFKARFESAADQFVVDRSVAAAGVGRQLLHRAGSPRAPLTILLNRPIFEIRAASVVVRSDSGVARVKASAYEGDALVAEAEAVCRQVTGGRVLEGELELQSSRPFHKVVITSESPDNDVGLGGFLAVPYAVQPGDLNYDGSFSRRDLDFFAESYGMRTDSNLQAVRNADLNSDGVVDAADFALLAGKIPGLSSNDVIVPRTDWLRLNETVLAGESEKLVGSALHLEGRATSWNWQTTPGKILAGNPGQAIWTAPESVAEPIDAKITATIIDPLGRSAALDFKRTVLANTFTNWANLMIDDPEFRTPTGDFDGDGIPNIVEYALGLDPVRRDRTADRFEVRRAGGGGLELAITRRKHAVGVTIQVEISPDLTSWGPPPASFGTARVVDNVGPLEVLTYPLGATVEAAGKSFFRLKISDTSGR